MFLALLMTAVPLAGCTGYDTELEDANERITELENQAEADQAKIAELEDEQSNLLETIGAQTVELENLCCTLEEMAIQYQYGYDIGYDDGWYDGYDVGWGGSSSGGSSSTLDEIISRGYMNCGIKDSQYGMGYQESFGVYSGLDIEYCKAVAAAIGLNPDTGINYVLAGAANRFDLLAGYEVDVLIRTTTWTASRDAELNADFAGINFYDGQGILVNTDAYDVAPTSALDLDGSSICVGIGTTTEGNIADYFAVNGMTYTAVGVNSWSDGMNYFQDGYCDAWTGDMSALVANKWALDTTAVPNSVIMPELLSKEPLAAATRDYDSDWNEIVSWVWYGMITAEELGVTSQNYATMATNSCDYDSSEYDTRICRLLGAYSLGLGTRENPLEDTWMQDVLEAVGNYGEAYDRAFCDGTYDGVSGSDAMSGCLISRAGTLNALVSEGGIQYAPPMR